MATNSTNPPDPAGPSLLDALVANRQGLGYALLVLGAALAAIPIIYTVLEGYGRLELIIWGAILSVACLGAGAFCLTVQSRPSISEADQIRLVLLVLGGVAGFVTTLLGLILPVTHYSSIFSGGLKEWSKNALTVWLCAAAVLGGAGLMFITLLLARSVERSNALLRRLMYGYNAIFSSFLLLAVLLLINVLAYTPLPAFGALQKTYDWTANSVYTLSPGTVTQLAALKKPVHVIVLLSSQSEALQSMRTLLDNARDAQPNLTWEQYSPELLVREQPDTYRELQKKYELPRDISGLVVVYGNDAESSSTFVPESALSSSPQQSFDEPPSSTKISFKGEAALMTAIDFLEGGKAKTVIYFTQGHGELSFGPERNDEGSLTVLTDLLGGGNYDFRPLPLDAKTKEIPADANIVVIPRPRSALPDAAVDALRAYLKGTNGKHGKLIALLNPGALGGPPYEDRALEGLLAEYNVTLGHDRILAALTNPPIVPVVGDSNSRNPIAQAITHYGITLPFTNVQTVRPGTNPMYKAEVLFQADPDYLVWSQKDLNASSEALVKAARQEAEQRNFTRFTQDPLPVAVGVSEAGGAPQIPGHEFLGGKPVLAVYGAGDWISNEALSGADKGISASVFKITVDWMRERGTLTEQIKTKSGVERDEFSLAKITPSTAWALDLAPAFVMLTGILALGVGVALVRRR